MNRGPQGRGPRPYTNLPRRPRSTKGPDLFGDITLLVGLTVGATAALARILRGAESRLRRDLKAEIADVRTELRGVEERLGGRIDVVRDELVETRVAMADRVARIEGRVFGVPLPGTGTDPA